jgi:NAD(P)-dependent dehydrogenase (short-subunit alcohol dehydrogenase family)
MPGLLQNHIAVVTGAGSGSGRGIALGYGREGAQVVALDINGETAGKTATDIRAEGGKAHYFTLDVTDRGACRAMAAKVASEVGRVSILVNNAGINRRMRSPPMRTPSSRIGRTSWRSISTACST